MAEFAKSSVDQSDTDFFEGISRYISPEVVRPEINAMLDGMKTGHRLIGMDGRIGMELLCRKIESMKGKMAEQDKYYTFDLFEEFLFAKMLDSYAPEVFAGEEDPYKRKFS